MKSYFQKQRQSLVVIKDAELSKKELLIQYLLVSIYDKIYSEQLKNRQIIVDVDLSQNLQKLLLDIEVIVSKLKMNDDKRKINYQIKRIKDKFFSKQNFALIQQSKLNSLHSKNMIKKQSYKRHNYTTQSINQFIYKVSKNQFQIQNLVNICCTKFLYFQTILQRQNKNIILSDVQKFQFFQNLQQILCAGYNSLNGAYILFGVDKDMKVLGIYLTQDQKLQCQRIFQQKLNYLRPQIKKNKSSIKFIPVLNHPLQPKTKQDLQKGRYVACIQIVPNPKYYGYIIEKKRKGFHTIYKSFKIQNNTYVPLQKEQIYQHLIKNIHLQKNRKHYHYNSKCQYPKQVNKLQQKILPYHFHQHQKKQQDKLQFKFRNNILIIVNSQNKQCYIDYIIDQLLQQKIKFVKFRPYRKYLQHTGRSIYVISYQQKFQIIKNVRDKVQKNIKDSPVNLFLCTTNLQLDQKLSNEDKIIQLQKQFLQQFKHNNFRVFQDKIQKKVYLRFNKQDQSIFSYIFLDRLRIRSHFVKDKLFKYKQLISFKT